MYNVEISMEDETNTITVMVNGREAIVADGDGMNNGDWYYELIKLCKSLGANVTEK